MSIIKLIGIIVSAVLVIALSVRACREYVASGKGEGILEQSDVFHLSVACLALLLLIA